VLALELVVWMLLRSGDRLVLPTPLLYGPRWIWLWPAIALLPLAVWRKSRLLPIAAAIIIALFPIMQLEINVKPTPGAADEQLAVVTFNSDRVRDFGPLRQVLEKERADLVAIQEWSPDNEPNVLPGWTLRCIASLCVGSRYPVGEAEVLDRSMIGGYFAMALRAVVTTPAGPISFTCVHLETVREGLDAVLEGRGDAIAELRSNIVFRNLESRIISEWSRKTDLPIVVVGDFNLPTDSAIFRQHWAQFSDSFENAGLGFGYTKFTRWWGARIDHVLYDGRWRALRAEVGPHIGSDHRPLIATLERVTD
jgi:endonuclease/exonuclease/phosphatase (EEP) superfamily protein YafD